MSERGNDEIPTERMSLIQSARALSDEGKHDEALGLLRMVQGQYTDDEMQAKVAYLVTLIETRQSEDPTGTLLDPESDDPSATRRIPRVE